MATIDRQLLLPKLIPNPDQYLMIAGLAGASKDAAGFTKDGANLFTMAGTMGASVSMGLGVALSKPKQPVISIAGDGELIMGIGSLLTVASMSPDNFTIICIDNGMHAETGGQLGHTSRCTDLAIMAKGAGIASVMTIDYTILDSAQPTQPFRVFASCSWIVESGGTRPAGGHTLQPWRKALQQWLVLQTRPAARWTLN